MRTSSRAALLRLLRRTSAPADAGQVPAGAPALLDAWTGSEIRTGQHLPEPYGPDHVVYLGLSLCPCPCGVPVGALVHHPATDATRTHPLAQLGVRWSGAGGAARVCSGAAALDQNPVSV
jgi:hypothetical protein